MAVAIKIENLSKQYRLGLVSTRTLSHDLNRWWQTSIRGKEDPYLKIGEVNDRATHGDSEYVWALRNLNLEVEQGEVLGIIGKNGAGKSTLLKILSKVTAPTTGTIKTNGRIASLLEVGTGFHYEMTGRENIYLNGAILGMTKSEIHSRLDEIVDFSGCERYIDTPVKRYSSGMLVRLGFAVAAHLEPEILIVDEVLAVGDAEFQKKAIGKMQDISRGQGRTVLLVSHNMGSIKNICSNGILLNKGEITYDGNVGETILRYTSSNLFLSQNSVQGIYDLRQHINKKNHKIGLLKAKLFCDDKLTDTVSPGSKVEILLYYKTQHEFVEGEIGIVIKDINEISYLGLNNKHLGKTVRIISGQGIARITIEDFPLYANGDYLINLYFGDIVSDYESLENAIKFKVINDGSWIYGRKPDDNWNKILHKKINIEII